MCVRVCTCNILRLLRRGAAIYRRTHAAPAAAAAARHQQVRAAQAHTAKTRVSMVTGGWRTDGQAGDIIRARAARRVSRVRVRARVCRSRSYWPSFRRWCVCLCVSEWASISVWCDHYKRIISSLPHRKARCTNTPSLLSPLDVPVTTAAAPPDGSALDRVTRHTDTPTHASHTTTIYYLM